ncbi:MAG: patatin family protein [Collinsella sp.]|nr:patatin family protein [Collinsella sp.]
MALPKTAHTVGLALEGGGYRGMYTAGVLDVWMEHGLTCDHMVGVSAGAAFGYNFKSRQIGRAIRYNKAYCDDKRYASVASWLRTGDMFNAEFAYHEVPIELDPIDLDAYRANPMRFTCVCTDIETGEAVYRDLPYGDERDIEWIRASSAIPVATRPVAIDGHRYLDGGVADSIPSAWLFAQGYDRNVVVLTQPAGFVKQANSLMPMLRRAFCRYPKFVAALRDRHEVYNATLDDLARREAAGEIFVVRPSESVKVPSLCREPDELERIYQIGRRDAEATLPALEAYLAG